jgi:glycogen debranching enzyme
LIKIYATLFIIDGGKMNKNYDFLNMLERGQYFEKRKYSDGNLYTYEEIKEKLPIPIYQSKKNWIDCYHYTVKILFSNTHKPTEESGYVSNFVDAAFNDDIFLWDTAFMTLFCNLFHPYIPGIRSLDNFYCKQFEDGEIPREMVRSTGKDFLLWVNAYNKPLYSYFHNHYGHRRLKEMTNLSFEEMYKPDMGRKIEKNPYLTLDNLNHPILAFAEWESYCHTKDIKRIQMVLEPLYQYYEAMKYHLRHKNGLYVTDWASMDNSTRNIHLGFAIDTSSEMVLFARNLIDMMKVLKESGYISPSFDERENELENDIEDLCKTINQWMWNEEDGFYYDVTFEGKQTGIKTVAAFWTLIADVPDENQKKRLVQWLEDEDTFKRIHRVPVLAANEPGYDPQGGYWRGSVWAPTNAMVVLGLEKTGYHKLAKEIALNHLSIVSKVFEQTGTIWENYPADFISSGNADNKDFVGWSGIGPILYLIQYGIGLSVDKNDNKLMWEIDEQAVSSGGIGCKNYWFSGKQVDLEAQISGENLVVRVQSQDTFELTIIYKEKIVNIHIEGDYEIIL